VALGAEEAEGAVEGEPDADPEAGTLADGDGVELQAASSRASAAAAPGFMR
jgi:hypothetical protein